MIIIYNIDIIFGDTYFDEYYIIRYLLWLLLWKTYIELV